MPTGKNFKSVSITIIAGILAAIVTLLGAFEQLSNYIYKWLAIYVPEICLLIFVTIVWTVVILFQFEKLFRNSIFKDSAKRIFLWAFLAVVLFAGAWAEYWAWQHQYCLACEDADICVIVDPFRALGWEDVRISDRIRKDLQNKFDSILPGLAVAVLSNIPECITDTKDRLKWACRAGATLIIHGTGDKFGISPEIRVCSENISEKEFEFKDYETEITMPPALIAQYDSGRFCMLDSVHTRTSYLTLFSLGLIFLYEDIPDMTPISEYKKSYDLFTKATAIEAYRTDCDLNYCRALYLRGLAATGVVFADNIFFDSACQSFNMATDILPGFTEAWKSWGDVYTLLAQQSSNSIAADLFVQSFEKYAAAVRIKPDFHEAFYNWGTALSDYAPRLDGAEAADLFVQSFEKYAAAVRIKPDKHEAFNNWGNALSDYAPRLDGAEAADLFGQSFEKYAAAVRIKPDFHEAFNNWGTALSDYAHILKGDAAAVSFRQSFEKYAQALRLKPDFYSAFRIWGISLVQYYKSLGNEPDSAMLMARASLIQAANASDLEICCGELISIINRVAEVDPAVKPHADTLRAIMRRIR